MLLDITANVTMWSASRSTRATASLSWLPTTARVRQLQGSESMTRQRMLLVSIPSSKVELRLYNHNNEAVKVSLTDAIGT